MYIIHFITGAYTIQHIHTYYIHVLYVAYTTYMYMRHTFLVSQPSDARKISSTQKKRLIRNRKEANTSE